MSESLLNIANKPWLMQANILVDMLTALGVIFLGAILFMSLREQNEKIALVALGFYILEGTLLAASRLAAFSLIGISQEYVTTGFSAYLLTMGKLAFESMDFVGSTLHMLAFCFGGILFYYLALVFDNSSSLPGRNPVGCIWGSGSILHLFALCSI